MARFHDVPSCQHPKEQSFADHSSSLQEELRVASQRSFDPNAPFGFDLRLEDELSDAKISCSEQCLLDHHPPSKSNEHAHHSYDPQIPSHSHESNYSPSTHIPSAAPEISSHTFPTFPSSTGSRSRSPGEHLTWTDDSSPSAPGRSFDSISFPLNSHSSDSAALPSVSPIHSRGNECRWSSNAHPSPGGSFSGSSPDVSQVKLGPNGLAEDQPPTAQGKMRTRVYVACLQCRMRKIRCDGGKPKCQKCARRSNECDYDAAPKRRGPDKKPGARQRISKKAKAAKNEACGFQNITGHVISHDARHVECLDTNTGSDRKRRKSSETNTRPFCLPADAGNCPESLRDSTSGAAEAPTPSPRDHIHILPTHASISDVCDLTTATHHKIETSTIDRLPGFVPHMQQSTPHHRGAFSLGLSLEVENSRVQDVPSTITHSETHAFIPDHIQTFGFPWYPSGHITVDSPEENQPQSQTPKWDSYEIGAEPSLDFSRKTWWDSLLATYLPGSNRGAAARQIQADLQFLFYSSNYFLSFFNVPLFFGVFCNPIERDKMQPSLVLAGLALSTFMKSSEINRGSAGRLRAMWLRDAAQSSLEASFNAQWIEPTLAQAAWLLALFEMCAHPCHSYERSNSAMVMLDSIIRSLGLTAIDADNPRVSLFKSRAVPVVPVPATARVSSEGCSCLALTLGHNSRSSHVHTPLWVATAAWNPDWTVAEIRKEESRRLCWSSLQIAAGHTSHSAAFSVPPLDYFCIQPSNYALLFPGEALLQSSSFSTTHSPKESIWALYSRAMLLWNSCLRMRGDSVSDSDKATFAVHAWIESTAIEEALDAHTCGCDQAFMYQGREFLFITRMCISHDFQRYIPHPESEVSGLFNRKKAEAWLLHQATIAKRMMHGLHTITGHKNNILAQRPFFIWWFMGQVARSLSLWRCDNSLIIALEVCRAFFPPMDYLSCLWPCPAQRSRYLTLHANLAQACQTAGLPSPPPPNFDLLAPGSPPVTVV
ncbi:hypothetical protein BU17DRAFT_81636 [Hysterangium stoloniferum]|nr:hypothetical protein BU17DRAFT_81636 [Hysterangium stoloniferum]